MPIFKGFDDPQYLRSEQYRDAGNLSARIQLHQRFSTNRYGWFPWLFDQLDVPDGAHILELSCGRGDVWWENRDRLPSTWRLTLTDLSAGMLDEARQRLATVAPHANFRVTDAQALPFADGMFDVVIANHMLYHVPDRCLAFQEIRRVLHPAGQVYAATNGRRHLRELNALVANHVPGMKLHNARTGFSLDNGELQLRRWFTTIERHDYRDALDVTEVEPLVAYVLSAKEDDLDPRRLDALREGIAQRITHAGAFHITKESGVFCCRVEA